MPKKFPEPLSVPIVHPEDSQSAGWPDLREALEAGDMELAERIAYHLGVPSGVLPAMAAAVQDAAELQAVIDGTADAAAQLEDVRRRLAAVRQFAPQSLTEAEERATREAELLLLESRLANDAGRYPVALANLAYVWTAFPELFGKPPRGYVGRPAGRLAEWASQHQADVFRSDWWQHFGTAAPRRAIRVVPAHSA